MEEHRANGCDLSVDVPFQYLTFFLEDDEQLEDIRVRYGKGELLSGEVKAVLIKLMQEFVSALQTARSKVTEADVAHFMSIRKIEKMPRKWLMGANAPAQAGVTVFSDKVGNMQTAEVQMAADLAGAHIRTQVVNDAKIKELSKKASIQGNAFPYFQLEDNLILTDSTAIARHLLRQSAQSDAMLGTSSAFGEAQINQVVAQAQSSVLPQVRVIEASIYGPKENVDGHAAAVKALKETCKVLNSHLTGKNWFVGNSLTYADVSMFTALAPAFQLCLDAGFRKAMPELARWFEKMARLPVVVGRLGYVKACARAVAPFKKA